MDMRTFSNYKAGLAGVLLLCVLSGTGCTIKEDRISCPAYLNVSFHDRDHIAKKVCLLGFDAGELFHEEIDIAEHDPYWVKAVRKGFLDLSACMGAGHPGIADHYVLVPVGNECDSLYAFRSRVDATGNMAYVEVVFHKQFCTVHLDLSKTEEQMQDYRFLVEGNTCGFDLLDFRPIPGAYRFGPVPVGGTGILEFRIPRQSDDSMTIALWHRNGNGTFEEAGRLPLGRYIAYRGYDWGAEDLQDLYIAIDLALGNASVSVDGWEDGIVFTLIEM